MDIPSVLAVVSAAHQMGATQQQRQAEVQLFMQLKEGEIRASAAAAAELTKPTQTLEAQLLGYGLLQYLVGARWEDFPPEDCASLPGAAYGLLRAACVSGAPWAVRSKAAAVLALVIKRSGPEFLKTGLAQLLEEATAGGPALQEGACLVLRYLADEVVQFTEDIDGEAARQLVTTLTSILVPILQFVEHAIEANFGAIAGKTKPEAAPHVAVVHAALGVAEAYAEWAPVGTMRQAGLVTAAGFLLRDPEFKSDACQALLKLVGRRLTADEDEEAFRGAMQEAGEALASTAAALLAPEANPAESLDYEGDADEFGQAVCEAMAVLGAGHMASAAPDPARRVAYLQYMLAFAQHPYLLLADKSLGLWAKLLQDAAAQVTAPASGSDAGSQPASQGAPPSSQPREALLPPEAVVALMELAAEHLQKRNPHLPQAEDDIPPYFDAFEDYKEFMIGYRLKLSSIVKAAAAVLPQQALAAAAARLSAAVAAAAGAGASPQALDQARVLLESAVIFTVSASRAVWEAAAAAPDEASRAAAGAAVVAATEPMLQSLLSLAVADPTLLQSQARGLDAFSRLIAVRGDLLPAVVTRTFELLVSCVPMEPGGQVAPPAKPPPGWREGFQARADVANLLLEYAKVAPQPFLPHLEGIARRLSELYDAGQIRPGERNAVTEALLAASLAGPPDLQASLAEWALAPVRAAWADPTWQARVASPQAFLQYYVPVAAVSPEESPAGVAIGCQEGRWALYHQVHMIERAVRRMQGAGRGGTPHPLAPHMAWAVPALLQLASVLNAVHTPAGREALGAAAPAIDMGPQERAFYLKKGLPGRRAAAAAAVAAGAVESDGGDYASVGGVTLGSLRAWLRHLREFVYHSLGMLPTCVPPALDTPGLAAALAPQALAFIDSLSHQNVRLIMRHLMVPHVKAVPAGRVAEWVLPQLAALTPHMQSRLAGAWADLASGTGNDGGASFGGATDEEIINDRLVRELTQEYADLLREVAGRVLESGDASVGNSGELPAPPGAAPGMGKTSKASSSPTLLQLLLEREPGAGIAAAAAAVHGMQLPDEAAYRFAMFCRALVALAPRDPQLSAYVGTEVLRAAITSLASEVMSTHQADVLGLIRGVLAQQLGDPGSPAHGVLQSLPGVSAERAAAFASAFLALNSEKQQRDAVKRFLVQACGRGSFAALADWRPPAALPAGALRHRGGRAAAANAANAAALAQGEAAAEEVLQGDITRALFA